MSARDGRPSNQVCGSGGGVEVGVDKMEVAQWQIQLAQWATATWMKIRRQRCVTWCGFDQFGGRGAAVARLSRGGRG